MHVHRSRQCSIHTINVYHTRLDEIAINLTTAACRRAGVGSRIRRRRGRRGGRRGFIGGAACLSRRGVGDVLADFAVGWGDRHTRGIHAEGAVS